MDESKATTKSVPLTVEPNNNLHKKLMVTSKPLIKTYSGKLNTHRMQQSNILDRVKNFLPKLISSNEALSSMDEKEKEKYDIENTDDCEKVIEMDISVVDNDILLSDNSDTDSDNDSSDEGHEICLNNSDSSNEKETISLVQEIL